MYNTMLEPHFEHKLQNKAMRSILQLNRFTPTTLMLDALRWLNVHKRLELNTLNFIKKNENWRSTRVPN